MKKWWQGYTRVIQTNLQVKDTQKIDPQRLAAQIEELGGNVLVFNVGGIYAWYHSSVPFHHVNEYLPENRDLLAEVIQCCHERGIRFVGRYDFSKTMDQAYQIHPEWFAYDKDGKPQIIGSLRPGEWSLLYSTCINSGYWNKEVAVPVLAESLSRYSMDAVFFNAPMPTPCHCDVCAEKYLKYYGTPMPANLEEADPFWRSRQFEENIRGLKQAIEDTSPGTPLILYHWPEQPDYLTEPLAEMVCDESQNVLSRGIDRLSDDWTPNLRMKLCALDSPDAPPFGIIHSSPGMDWRHTGLPPAEYRFWLSQVQSGGGSLWHSLTGVPDTISDQRILHNIKTVNQQIIKQEQAMEYTRPVADVTLLYDRKNPPKGWLRALYDKQILFDILPQKKAAEQLNGQKLVLLHENYPVDPKLADALEAYVKNGGCLLLEGKIPPFASLFSICGVKPTQKRGEYLTAAYLRPHSNWTEIATCGLGESPLLPMRGKVSYSALDGADILATLVPSFAPMDAVGAPPERASLPTPYTDIPLCLENHYGKGRVLTLTFSLSHLIEAFGLSEHLQLAESLFHRAITDRSLEITHYPGLIANLYQKENTYVLHLVNGSGKRPLSACLPLHGLEASVLLPQGEITESVCLLDQEQTLPFNQKGQHVSFIIENLDVWTIVEIKTKTK